jgi:hypothetical protein
MPKIKDRYILFSSGIQGTNDGDIPSIFLNPTNFTPTQVSSEGNDKISAYLNGINSALGELVKLDGTRTMTGSLNMGTFNITNAGTINGVTIQSHASRHLPGGADALTTAAAVTLNANSLNTEGTAISFARSDHTHDLDTSTAVTINANSSNQEGSSASLARADHTHDIDTGVVSSQTPDQTNSEGTSANLARADHVHNIPTATPVSTGTANAQGTANSFARSDHVHNTVITSSTQKATDSVTTTSTSDVLLSGMTVTPAAGTYKVMAHASSTLSSNTNIFFSLYVGGSQVSNSEGQRTRASNQTNTQRMDWNFFDDVTVNGTQAIEIRWRVASGTGTAYDRQLSILKVG